MELGQPRRDQAVAALEARLGWRAVMAEGCRWVNGEPGKGAWKWCGAACIVSSSAGTGGPGKLNIIFYGAGAKDVAAPSPQKLSAVSKSIYD